MKEKGMRREAREKVIKVPEERKVVRNLVQ